MQLLPRHRYMLQKVDAAFGIYDESTTEFMFLHHGVMDKVCYTMTCMHHLHTSTSRHIYLHIACCFGIEQSVQVTTATGYHVYDVVDDFLSSSCTANRARIGAHMSTADVRIQGFAFTSSQGASRSR